MGLRVNLAIPLNSSSGYGNDGIGLSRALLRAGCDLSLEPSHVMPPLPWDIAQLLTIEPRPPYDLLLQHLYPMGLGLTHASVKQAYKKIAWTMWEFYNFKESEQAEVKGRTTGFDKVLLYDETSKAAYESLGEGLPPLGLLQGGYEPDPWILQPEDRRRDWGGETFRFVIAGDLQQRKNPFLAMRVVQRLADEGYNVELVVKTRHENSFPIDVRTLYPCVRVFAGNWSQKMMRQYYADAHCYLAPSLGEGKNLPALEAGTTGCAIIASDIGGHRMWAHPVFATLIGGNKTGEYDERLHIRVDEGQFYNACKELVEDRAKAQSMGEQASRIIPASMSWDRVVQDLLNEHVFGG